MTTVTGGMATGAGTGGMTANQSSSPLFVDPVQAEAIRERCSSLSSTLPQKIDPSALGSLQQLDMDEAFQILDEVQDKHDLRNVSAFIVSKVQKVRLKVLLEQWGGELDREARQLLRSVPTRRAVEVLELAETQRQTIRNPSAFICSAVRDKNKWPQVGGGWPDPGWPPWPGGWYNEFWAQAMQAAHGFYGAYGDNYSAAPASSAWPGAPYGPWMPGSFGNYGFDSLQAYGSEAAAKSASISMRQPGRPRHIPSTWTSGLTQSPWKPDRIAGARANPLLSADMPAIVPYSASAGVAAYDCGKRSPLIVHEL